MRLDVLLNEDKQFHQDAAKKNKRSAISAVINKFTNCGINPQKGAVMSDKQTEKNEQEKLEFVYPDSDEFPLDHLCGDIVRELEKNDWQVPDIKTYIWDKDPYGKPIRYVEAIIGQDFKLLFGRVYTIDYKIKNPLFDTPSRKYEVLPYATMIVVPKMVLHIFGDGSGPLLYLYTGEDWERDKEKFMTGHPAADTYLGYKGSDYQRATRSYQPEPRSMHKPFLARDDWGHMGINPNAKGPDFLESEQIIRKFSSHLHEVKMRIEKYTAEKK